MESQNNSHSVFYFQRKCIADAMENGVLEPEESEIRVRRQVFIPSTSNTNTFVYDTASFLAVLTLVVFIVRVFNRVMESNNVQTVTVATGRTGPRSLESSRNIVESDFQRQVMTELRSNDSTRKRSINPQSRKRSINSYFSHNSSQPLINKSIR